MIWKIPSKISFEEAAALGGVGPREFPTLILFLYVSFVNQFIPNPDTAFQALYLSQKLARPSAPISDGEPFLVYGGSTSVGMYAIQLAKLSGYTVIATSSASNFDLLKSLGATAVYDCQSPFL